MLKMLLKEKELHILTFNRDKNVTPDTIIPIERINGPVLLLSSRHDEGWESYQSSLIMEKRLSETGFPHAHKHISFPYLSHAMMTESSPIYKLFFKRERIYPDECAAERRKLQKILLYWIKKVWK